MNGSGRSKISFGFVALAVLLWGSFSFAQMASSVRSMPAGPARGADVVRIRKAPQSEKIKTPIYQTAMARQSSGGLDWWHGIVEFDTSEEWIDELEFTYYAYVEDQSNRGAPIMFRASVTYVNIPKGRHHSDVFLHPNTVKRMGAPKQVAVIVKYKGAVVATENTASRANWWDGYPPVDGVLLNRAMTPFSLVDYDLYPAIKPVAATR
ncbi:MAG: hypothetical protein LBN38_08380 [Verrucomicrobiota bacterium]|jgi:hypothetical protein|nr:hypothetical protein [Verrucomicrobiota bacterium]